MNTDIHRLLDGAFAGVEMTPDAQDLKEEIRANLVARVEELEASGVAPADAASRAITELGDVREMLGEPSPVRAGDPQHAEFLRHRVRPEPAFVVRTVVLSIVAAGAVALFALGAFRIVPLGLGGMIGLGLVFAAALGIVTADALLQETTANHPMRAGRAAGFGAGTFGVLAALVVAAVFALTMAQAMLVVAVLLLVASIALLSWLGATQTNRHKAWTRDAWNQSTDRFTQHPEVAARFGIYTVVIWLAAAVLVLVLGFTVSWWWAPVVLIAGFAAMLLLLARMLFGHSDKSDTPGR